MPRTTRWVKILNLVAKMKFSDFHVFQHHVSLIVSLKISFLAKFQQLNPPGCAVSE